MIVSKVLFYFRVCGCSCLLFGVALVFCLAFPFQLAPSSFIGSALAQEELTPEQRGRGKAQLCTRCHGRIGLARAALAQEWKGTVETFIVLGLSQFRDGSRAHAVMNAVAQPMSDLDIRDVAAWYEKVSGLKKTK